MIITLTREIGAGGSAAATRVAEALRWKVVDNELVDQIAARSGLSPAEVAEREERAPGFVERLFRMLTKAAPEIFPAPSDSVPELEEAKLVKVTETVVSDMAREGRVVLVGRAAPAVLRQERDALHFKLVAPKPYRIAQVAARERIDSSRAAEIVKEADENRSRYHQQHYGRDWNDASNYHLVLNTGALGLDTAVELMVGQAIRVWGQGCLGALEATDSADVGG
jgi:cytidylate kinase